MKNIKLAKKEFDIILKILKFKLKTESPFDLKKADLELRQNYIRVVYFEVLDEIITKKYPLSISDGEFENLAQKIKNIEDDIFMNTAELLKNIPEYGCEVDKSEKPAKLDTKIDSVELSKSNVVDGTSTTTVS